MTAALLIGLAFLLSLSVSFALSGMEAGMLSVNHLRLRRWMREGNPAARRLYTCLQNPERFLWTILVGNVLANFFVLTLAFFLLHAGLGGGRTWLAGCLGVTFLLYALVDLLPKMLFRSLPTRLSLAFSRFHGWISLALGPVVAPVTWLANVLLRLTGGRRFTGRMFGNLEELRLVMQESGGALTTEERSMINRVLDLQGMTAGGLTVPLDQATCVAPDTTVSEILNIFRREPFGRLPVRDRESGRVLGYVSLRAMLYGPEQPGDRPAGEVMLPVLHLQETDLIEQALRRFRRSGQRLAIVLDRHHQEIGILTLEDILRHIFGRLPL
ncbi:MAG: DUF21 domain-containing protein [Verrucomicrobiales bacterium]|nr:DUF21 domain-containing protein [Verrucomicrobiales bacterium]MCP5525989.1 DUF21 domain-containing protein [Verrucomicrobiales bacterium]